MGTTKKRGRARHAELGDKMRAAGTGLIALTADELRDWRRLDAKYARPMTADERRLAREMFGGR